MTKNLTISATVLAAALTLAGCSAGTGTAGSSMPSMDHGSSSMPATAAPLDTVTPNAADIMFVQGMIPHHSQAVEMSDIILQKPDIDPQVTALATKIKAAQAPEISTMTGWLKTWNEPEQMAPGHEMTGMMGEGDLDELRAAEGTEAAKLFLTQMVVHHQGAVMMAQTEEAQGRNADALALSKNIITSQQAEIEEMQILLGSL
ncbi:DUF305 domain-containing protein [Pseudarthrobacter sp. NBSH8]|uniref:DUF305 domain-containing protein n=1 Tax=Pseudarthrobacter sp. NBSH8 TaxID=2596911 RepID=UPI001625A040|nr:DUF305 domain-containing protein [Pseudarthrobacter sp. NBSH8]QNE13854.1 DUF305 domain-containing protein [Pseudarthrobacter sp. NBSH8]